MHKSFKFWFLRKQVRFYLIIEIVLAAINYYCLAKKNILYYHAPDRFLTRR